VRLIFLGTSDFAVPALRSLVAAGHEFAAVVTAPPRPAGRGRRLTASPVDDAARRLELPVLQPVDPNDLAFVEALHALAPELGVLVAYGYILRRRLLAVPRHGLLNLHPSLLPRYRGAAPIQRCLMDGAAETGVAVIRMSRAVDAGDVVALERAAVGPDETAGELSARLAELGARLLVRSVSDLAQGRLAPRPQDPSGATAAPKIDKSDRVVDWSAPAQACHDRIRALSPEPGAVSGFRGRRVVLLRSRRLDAPAGAEPGTLASESAGVSVACSDRRLELLQLRPEGGKTISGIDFCHGYRVQPGERMAPP
jgi:methionyl-tRNA formyltransferase